MFIPIESTYDYMRFKRFPFTDWKKIQGFTILNVLVEIRLETYDKFYSVKFKVVAFNFRIISLA